MNKKPKAVVLDLDNTCVGFSQFLCSLHNKIYGTTIIEKDVKTWDLPKELYDLYKRFENHGLYNELPLLSDAVLAINHFSLVGGYKIIFLTARDDKFGEDTYLYLLSRSMKFDELLFNKNKVDAIKKLSKKYHVSLFADDKLETVEAVFDKCRVDMVCLIDKHYNKSDNLDPEIKRVDSLLETVRYLK